MRSQTELPASHSVSACRVEVPARRPDFAAVRIRLHLECLRCRNQVVNRSATPRADRLSGGHRYQDESQVVKQFPEEAVLRRRAYFHALDLTGKAPPAPECLPPQGLSHRVLSVLVTSRTSGGVGWAGFTPRLERFSVGLIEVGACPLAGSVTTFLTTAVFSPGQRKLRVAYPERIVLDQHFLEFAGTAALVLHLGTEAGDVRDAHLERLAGRHIFRSSCPHRGSDRPPHRASWSGSSVPTVL